MRKLSLFLILIILLAFVRADVVSFNSGGDNNLAANSFMQGSEGLSADLPVSSSIPQDNTQPGSSNGGRSSGGGGGYVPTPNNTINVAGFVAKDVHNPFSEFVGIDVLTPILWYYGSPTEITLRTYNTFNYAIDIGYINITAPEDASVVYSSIEKIGVGLYKQSFIVENSSKNILTFKIDASDGLTNVTKYTKITMSKSSSLYYLYIVSMVAISVILFLLVLLVCLYLYHIRRKLRNFEPINS